MSAKNSNFALVNAENMDFNQYTKTCSRCALSWYERKGKAIILECPKQCGAVCRFFRAQPVTHEYFFGRLDVGRKIALTHIYLDRIERGEF